ncbi:hypothetical protein [Devosia riboflavina]
MRHSFSLLAAIAAGLFAVPAMATDYPLKLDNCGFALDIAAAPHRVVAIKSTAAELLLSLGLEEQLVGLAFLDGPLPEALGGTGIPVLSEKLPSQEVVLRGGAGLCLWRLGEQFRGRWSRRAADAKPAWRGVLCGAGGLPVDKAGEAEF